MPVAPVRSGMRPRAKVYLGSDMIGAGKIELLGHVARTGSRLAAAETMGMTLERAAFLLSSMEACFEGALIEDQGAQTQVTPLGKDLLERYESLQAGLDAAAEPFMAWMDQVARRD
ncbi:MAG: hypothetical protein AAF679_01010 [Pseudomonadota bacterium]